MVSFQCEACGDVLKKAKLDAHSNRCRNPTFTCLDCQTSFWNGNYKSHTSCISEAQKYEGALYQEKKSKQNSKAPRVEDVAETPPSKSLPKEKKVTFVPLPPAPSPPPATTPLNVHTYKSRRSDASSSSDSSDSEYEKRQKRRSAPPLPPAVQAQITPHAPAGSEAAAYWYPQPPPHAGLRTPAPPSEPQARLSSEKKRKRATNDDADPVTVQRAPLQHSGLTGGVGKLLSAPEDDGSRAPEPSPLEPKKRHKKSTEAEIDQQLKSLKGERRELDKKEKKDRKEKKQDRGSDLVSVTSDAIVRRKDKSRSERSLSPDARVERGRRSKEIEAPRARKLLTSGSNASSSHRGKGNKLSNSEYFLTLIDKGPDSAKGQSIWGALKMFHEGKGSDDKEDVKEEEQKRLLKGLRCKINKNGEIVLFARPEAEDA